MHYDFDEVVNRYNTYSMKYDGVANRSPELRGKMIPLMVADMDFKTAKPIIDAMHRVADFGMWGYTSDSAEPEYAKAVARWFSVHHNWEINPEDVIYSNGTIEALNCAIHTFTNVGDGVIVCRPVYGHFTQAIEDDCHRRAVNVQLILDENGCYQMDYEGIEAACADPSNRMFILCSPHNPVGRVWTPDELIRVAEICRRHNVLLVSDEVHCDILRKGVKHYPLASVVKDHSNIIMLTAINKTFNLAGLQCSNAVISDPFLKARFLKEFGMRMPTPFAIAALIAAYTEGDEWAEQMNEYVDGNLDFALSYFKEHMPWVKAYKPQGTYVLWVDFSGCGLTGKEIHKRIYDDAQVLLQDGAVHDPMHGECFQRICVPCSRSVLKEALDRICEQFKEFN